MKAYLMYSDTDFILDDNYSCNYKTVMKDLELDVLFQSLSAGDKFLYSVVKQAFSRPLIEVHDIEYRQSILRDCLYNRDVIRDFYRMVVECLLMEKEKLHFGLFGHYPSTVLHQSIRFTRFLLENLKKIRFLAEKITSQFESPGMTRLLTMITMELNDNYLNEIEAHLKQMEFKKGVLMSVKLGQGNKGFSYVLRQPNTPDGGWFKRLFAKKPEHYIVQIAPRDENGFRALSNLKDEGLALVACAMAQATAHLLNFFNSLRAELGFYIACLNLSDALNQRNVPFCFPVPMRKGERYHVFEALSDTCLVLTTTKCVVSNTLNTDNKNTFIITGANQGGKSTFLRSIGLAQMMMQSGMFVSAKCYSADVCRQVFTHYKCEEDSQMVSGKLDEELRRMRDIVNALRHDDLVLFNESFSATNSREGAEIIKGVVKALAESEVKVFFVTHSSEFACAFYQEYHQDTVYLCAERRCGGKRTFKIIQGEPQETSYGEDLYRAIFTKDDQLDDNRLNDAV
ncbi:MutS-related protein [Hafnia psychrotolerans]|uniref:DNA mismatch repair protein MutS n=1 Tax=Hafnia psychrotolerans TaxID=1477018 RepID=A0ABQ1GIZ8_9GAMM|nr:DNA mismatch repair protein MutS [Hafnia psychrotolerans]GGA44756.1 DNA mismatch repair protein MutS [Hafnia psychrotolerans]